MISAGRTPSRYAYELVDGRLIHVYGRSSYRDHKNLLEIRIHDFSVEGAILPAAVIVRIGELAPEMASYLAKKQTEYYKTRGITPSFPGVTMRGNMDPQIKIHLKDPTVRQIPNAVAFCRFDLNKNSTPDWTGNKLSPTS